MLVNELHDDRYAVVHDVHKTVIWPRSVRVRSAGSAVHLPKSDVVNGGLLVVAPFILTRLGAFVVVLQTVVKIRRRAPLALPAESEKGPKHAALTYGRSEGERKYCRRRSDVI